MVLRGEKRRLTARCCCARAKTASSTMTGTGSSIHSKYGSDCPLTLTAPLSLFEGECTAVHGAREVA